MINSIDFGQYGIWSGYIAIACFLITLLAFILGWGFRFRLVGVTSFMIVLTGGLLALNLSLFNRVEIPDAMRYAVVYDNAANQAVIAVKPPVTEKQVIATLKQASYDLFSRGRLGVNSNQLTIRLRAIEHTKDGISNLRYLGQIQRSLTNKEDTTPKIEIFSKNLKIFS